MLWPSFAWERADPADPSTSWEAYRNCIGAMVPPPLPKR